MRYAIYFMPPPGDPLWAFGCSVLGYDAATGKDMAFPGDDDFADLPLADWTSEPRRYGFHATLKAPFELAAGCCESDLLSHARRFCARAPFTLPPLALVKMGRFVALVAPQPSPALQGLAADCVRDFDGFRAPMSAAERARRLAHPLPERQVQNLERWGYPYVMQDFTFHMTLSGSLGEPDRSIFHAVLLETYAPLARPLAIDALAVFVQSDRKARFRLLERIAFT